MTSDLEQIVEALKGLLESYAAVTEDRKSRYISPNGICVYDNARSALAIAERLLAEAKARPTGHVEIAHDGFAGDIIGHYTTREGKRGVVVQQDGTRVVHVYGEKWLSRELEAVKAGGGR